MEKRPKRWLAPYMGTPASEISLCALSHPCMWMPESYSEVVCTAGRFRMNLIGSVLPSICGMPCIRSILISVIPPGIFLMDEECFPLMKMVLSISLYNESVCAEHSVFDKGSDNSTNRNDIIYLMSFKPSRDGGMNY